VLQPAHSLSPAELDDVATLEARVVAHDGGRLKLSWSSLRERRGDQVHDLLWRESDGTLTGFLGLYQFAGAGVELAGMVDPTRRRHGVGTALVRAARALLADRGEQTALLVTPRSTPAGAAFAAAHHAPLDHSEHAMQLQHTPQAGIEDPQLVLRNATPADLGAVAALLVDGFGFPTPPGRGLEPGTLVVEAGGEVIGTLAVNRLDTEAGIYGFVISSELRGRGIGRDVLTRVCRSLRADGVNDVHLDVEVANDNALGLYESVGFTRRITEDYFTLPVASADV
jgi:ribosomal protein S18 acetylase RimI-like enzyme